MTWNIDPVHSLIGFSVRHMMIAKVRGRFNSFTGTVNLNADNPGVEGTVDVASIDTRENDRDEHLRSADFFDAANFPQMRFRSTRIESAGNGKFNVTGDLTIKDVTRPVTFAVTDEGQGKDPWGGLRQGYSATAKINRKDFGLTWNVALETGGWLVGDEITINAEVELVQTQPQPEAATMA